MKSARDILSASHIPPERFRVAVGLSGGVDSMVSAWLLREAGHEVTGLTMKLWDPARGGGETAKRGGCYGPGEAEDIACAQRLAERLGIPHRVVSLIEDYERYVLDYYRGAYRCGLTPNPCAVCNPVMKFGLLPETARREGLSFDYFATGHYVMRVRDERTGLFRLFQGADSGKDQSYFLARLEQAQLAGALFPLGSLEKNDVREIARQIGLGEMAGKPESQDFYDGKDHGELFEDAPARPGDIVDTTGKVLGRHRGIIHYTIGQREGLGIAAGRKMYVSEIRPETNQIVVGERDVAMSAGCRVVDIRWLSGRPPEAGRRLTVRLRYRHPGVAARLVEGGEDALDLEFETPQFAVTPGQLAAFYDGREILGGGWISRSPANAPCRG